MLTEIPFLLECVHNPGGSKPKFTVWIGLDKDVHFELMEGTLAGKALYKDEFPLEYEIHPSLEPKLNDWRRTICEKIIHHAISLALPLFFCKPGANVGYISPAFPLFIFEEYPPDFDLEVVGS